MQNSTQNITENKKTDFSFIKALNELISGFPERSRDIISARYGLTAGKPQTLEEIGKNHKITRERVRQIIEETLRKIKALKNSPVLSAAAEKTAFTISKKNGIMKKEELVALISRGNSQEAGAFGFFLNFPGNVIPHEIKGELKKSYALPEFSIDDWKKLKNAARNVLESEKRMLTGDELTTRISHRLGSSVAFQKIFNYLSVSEEIKKNNFGKWGLADWEETNPKNTREKAYLVLKENGEPLHFTEIAKMIDQHGLSRKKTHFQTVHNELIKSDRFVLVGRGVYALAEWGYKEGTVKEVLEEILKKSAKPMKYEDIVSEVLKTRQVKKSTVTINLNNFFSKVGKNEYSLKLK